MKIVKQYFLISFNGSACGVFFFCLKKHVFGRKKSGPRERHFEMPFVCPTNYQKRAKRPKMTKVHPPLFEIVLDFLPIFPL